MFEENIDLELLKLETAMDQNIKDLKELAYIEEVILTTESPDIVSHYHNMIFGGEETFNTESAVAGKDTILGKITAIKDRIVKTFEENNLAITGFYKNNFSIRITKLKELSKNISDGTLELKENVDNTDLNQYFGLFNLAGYNMSNPNDVIKAFGFHEDLGLEILRENMKYAKKMSDTIFSADSIVESIKRGKLESTTASLKFLNSFKDVEFKKQDFKAGFPTMIFTRNPAILLLSITDKDKINIDTDVIKPKQVKIGSYKKEDIIKMLDIAIAVASTSGTYTSKLAGMVNYVLPNIIHINGSSSTYVSTKTQLESTNTTPMSLLTNTQRYTENLMVYTKHLGFTPYNIVKIIESIVKNNFTKK